MNLRRHASFAVLLVTLFTGWKLEAKEKPESLLGNLPETIAECRQGKPQSYGDARLGNSVDYDREGLHITVYAYDLGNATIANGITDPVVKETFDSAKKDIGRAVEKKIYTKFKAIDDGTGEHGPGLTTLKATFQITPKGAKTPADDYYSEIHVYGARNFIIKLRISTQRIQEPEIAKTILRFVPALMEAVNKLPKDGTI